MSSGRCWPSSGLGGTLNAKGTAPGPFFVQAAVGQPPVGGGSDSTDMLRRAVFYGVRAIQRALNRAAGREYPPVKADGLFGSATSAAVVRFQRANALADDGVVGPLTSKVLFMRDAKRLATTDVPACLIGGLIGTESAWDPAAVGSDTNDKGLLQINLPSHLNMTEESAFEPGLAIKQTIAQVRSNLAALHGNLRDAVAAYNLGVGGTRSWIAAGRPDVWQPAGSTTSRNVAVYIAKILADCPPTKEN